MDRRRRSPASSATSRRPSATRSGWSCGSPVAAGLPRAPCGNAGTAPRARHRSAGNVDAVAWYVRCSPLRTAAQRRGREETTMIRRKLMLVMLSAVVGGLAVAGCGRSDLTQRDHIHQTELKDVRLGDGVPLAFSVAIRWRIEDARGFTHQFVDPSGYAKLVLDAKSREVAGKVANAYPSVAAVFKPEREKFVQEMKT